MPPKKAPAPSSQTPHKGVTVSSKKQPTHTKSTPPDSKTGGAPKGNVAIARTVNNPSGAVAGSQAKVKKLAKKVPPLTQSTATADASSTVRKWTKEDEAALKIQRNVKRFLAQKLLMKKKIENEKYEQLMEQLEHEAYAKLVRMHQEEMERERQKEEEERRKRQEMAKKQKRMLEAAFDGDNDAVLTVLKEIKDLDDKSGLSNDVIGRARRAKNQLALVECVDANNNTPLSEAANGGHPDTVKLLIELGADPNSRGQFQRTPLYRAAFSGHLETVQILLQNGADPRLYADDGQTPEQETSFEPVRQLLSSWDISQTETLLKKIDADKEQRRNEDRQRIEAEAQKIEDQVETADKEYKMAQKKLIKASEELNKRICEHDMAVSAGYARTDVTVQMIHDAEAEVELVKLDVEKTREKLAQLKLALREKRGEGTEQQTEESFPGVKVFIKELDDVLMRDVGDCIRNSNKWPLIIDPSGQAATFLRYRDTNYINALSPNDMQSERIRLSVLGALRYGKPLVLDMMEVDMFETCIMRFDEVQRGLLPCIIDKSILKEQVYVKLCRKQDGDQYNKCQFNAGHLANFKFFLVTKNPSPSPNIIEMTYPITVSIPGTGL